MSLAVQHIEFRCFRNYGHLRLSDLSDLVVLVGKNGVGKTNILEGVQLLATGSSFRHAATENLLQEGRDGAYLSLTCAGAGRIVEIAAQLERGKRRFLVNGKPKKVSDVRGTLPVVSFVPDDLKIAKGSSSIRRDALDYLGSQLSKSYDTVLRDYEKVIRYKNRLLKDEAPDDLVASINETLVLCGSQLHCFRVNLFNRFAPLLQANYARISGGGEVLSADYAPSTAYLLDRRDPFAGHVGEGSAPDRAAVQDSLHAALGAHAGAERERKTSLVGPHNDKIRICLAGRDAAAYASQGQQRSIVLAWKTAEVDLVEQTLQQYPVLLLDDVMSELDMARRDALVDFVLGDTQTFMTATDLSCFGPDILGRAQVVELPLAD